MPERKLHLKLDRLLFGREHNEVHKILDLPSAFLGTEHRRLFHSPIEAAAIGFLIDGFEGMLSALAHVELDNNELLRKLLEVIP